MGPRGSCREPEHPQPEQSQGCRASLPLTCVRTQVPLEGGMAGESAIAFAADVAAHSRVHLHVLLQGGLRLEPLAAQQAEDSHIGAWEERGRERSLVINLGNSPALG